jgi:hypothetical protein
MKPIESLFTQEEIDVAFKEMIEKHPTLAYYVESREQVLAIAESYLTSDAHHLKKMTHLDEQIEKLNTDTTPKCIKLTNRGGKS